MADPRKSSEPPVAVPLPGQAAYKDEQCYLVPFTFFDVKEVSNANAAENIIQIDSILQRRCSMNIKDLMEPDITFIMYWLRHNSYSTFKFTSYWVCPYEKCQFENASEIPLEYDELPPTYNEKNVLNLSSGPAQVRLPLRKDKDEVKNRLGAIVREAVLSKEPMNDSEIMTLRDVLITACMLEPTGKDFEERLNLVHSMTPDDAWSFIVFERDHEFGVKMVHSLTCEECERTQEVSASFTPTRFLPEYTLSSFDKTRVYAGDGVRDAITSHRESGLLEAGRLVGSESGGEQESSNEGQGNDDG